MRKRRQDRIKTTLSFSKLLLHLPGNSGLVPCDLEGGRRVGLGIVIAIYPIADARLYPVLYPVVDACHRLDASILRQHLARLTLPDLTDAGRCGLSCIDHGR